MRWLEEIVEKVINLRSEGEILVSSGASPSGAYHFGHIRELVTCDAVVMALQKRGREARHIHIVDDLDAFRKIPINLSSEYEQYLGMPLCDIPAPDGSDRSFADYCFDPFCESMKKIGIEFDVVYSSKNYRSGFYSPAFEVALNNINEIKQSIESVSTRQLDENWVPIQVLDNGRWKNCKFISMETDDKSVKYESAEGEVKNANYEKGEVKFDWRVDWPSRWWLMKVAAEPFGRDHATKGGSYDTGSEIIKTIYGAEPPVPIPYDFINRTGDTKKMSASKGTGVDACQITDVLPAEVVRYFMLRYSPSKRLFFDETDSLVKLIDDYAELLAKADKSADDQELINLCSRGVDKKVISSVPFSHLVESYQASLCDVNKTLEVIGRTEYSDAVKNEAETIANELEYVSKWIKQWAPDEMKFCLVDSINSEHFNDAQKSFLHSLADQIAALPADANGQAFHELIYSHKETCGMSPGEMFATIYLATIGKKSGPRAGWFLSILPRDWLTDRFKIN